MVILTLALAMPKPSPEETTQPIPDVFNAERVLGMRLFELEPLRARLAKAVMDGRTDEVTRAAKEYANAWASTRAAAESFERQLSALTARSRVVALATCAAACATRQTLEEALVSIPFDAAANQLVIALDRDAASLGLAMAKLCVDSSAGEQR
jgi:hypothetical protein